MKRKFFLLLFVYLGAVGSVAAQKVFRVDEAATKVLILKDHLNAALVFENPNRALAAHVKLEIIAADDRVITTVEAEQRVGRGRQTISQKIPFDYAAHAADYLWYRLRYTIAPDDATRQKSFGGIVSLSEISPEMFEIQASAVENIHAGMNYPVRVRAFQPVTRAPSANVGISGEIALETDDGDVLPLKLSAVTDRDGEALLEFVIPPNAKFDDGDVSITGEKKGITRRAANDLSIEKIGGAVYLNTDKPLYQPNQKLFVRGLFLQRGFSEKATEALAARDLEFVIRDEDRTILYRETVQTSRFGIASVAWQIPDNAKLGTYEISVNAADETDISEINFKVSRYELPTFTVNVETDRTFYLPAEKTAKVAVAADYLSGRPVSEGKVKIVREASREWNYKDQKWEVEEEKIWTGATDANGRYVAEIDLTKAHADLQADEDARFADVRFEAYFTDATTNRTEQRRFDVRVSKQAIHVYAVNLRSDGDRNPHLPVRFYVTTFYADGTPAACDVTIAAKHSLENGDRWRTLTRLKTGASGAGKVLLKNIKPDADDYYDDLDLRLTAIDANGRTGTREDEISVDEDASAVQLTTDKTIYRAGEPLKITVAATEKEETVFVDVVQFLSVIESRIVHLKNGRATLEIPYRPAFKNKLTVAAYFNANGKEAHASRGIIYPQPTDLQIKVTGDQSVYRPNEEATLNFSVLNAQQTPLEAALGTFVFDQAIEERARRTAEFDGARINQFSDYEQLLDDDLNRVDATKSISAEQQLRAEIALADWFYRPTFFESDVYGANLQKIFAAHFNRQFNALEKILKARFAVDFAHPTDDATLRSILAANAVDFDQMDDPWGDLYQPIFSIENGDDVFSVASAGANKIFGDRDDLILLTMHFAYFTPVGAAIERATTDYHRRTGDFIRDYATLERELGRENINLNALRDRWNQPYQIIFGTAERFYTINFISGGRDGKLADTYDNFTIWSNKSDYFADAESRWQAILSNYVGETKTFPANEAEFRSILKSGGVDFDAQRDGWQRPLKLSLTVATRFADRIKTESAARFGNAPENRTTITPVTRQIAVFRVRGAGADGVDGNSDDVTLATFSGVLTEQAKDDAKPVHLPTETVFGEGRGAVVGIIGDAAGAVVPNAKIIAVNKEQSATIYETASDAEGAYRLENLPAGNYSIRVESAGFSDSVVENVPVRATNATELSFTLSVVGATVTVDVTAGADAVDSTASAVSASQVQNLPLNGRRLSQLYLQAAPKNAGGLKAAAANEKSTPRLREYFPETLVWSPELITDRNGRAQLKFRLGDNITNWKLYAIASDAKGKIGVATREFKSFQPFFADLEPPKTLTVGDEIALPVPIRNYTAAPQKVQATMANGDWFSLLDAARQTVEIAANDSANAVFRFRADAPVADGKQRVTAIAAHESDAVEKTVTVKPNGREIVRTQSEVFRGAANFAVDFPAETLPATQRAQLVIYPNLPAHVAESIEGLLQRPYGCGEQVISSTYPNLMFLKFAAKDNPRRANAERNLRQGYERLLAYQHANGGFSVWTQDAPDAALTAYAIRFLTDAQSQISVDQTVIENARRWLLEQQRADGSWARISVWEKVENTRRTTLLTAYVARILAMNAVQKPDAANQKTTDARRKAFEYLNAKTGEITEPYALALYGIALFDAGDSAAARKIAVKLAAAAAAEGAGVYWNLETNTPFYGWGTAGRIETTALVVQLLTKIRTAADDRETADLVGRGTTFLLTSKDRYGVWYSTQTTINVLDALLAVIADGQPTKPENRVAEIFINEQKLKDIALPPENAVTSPINLNLPVAAADNRVTVKISGGQSALMAQIVQTHYVGWRENEADGRAVNQSRALRFEYECDKLTAHPTEEIKCQVAAERVGFEGYGMLLAEIGLPPGADVDRASLEKAQAENSGFSRYEILPDKIIVYFWAQAGGTKFNFTFKPRYGINAQTAPSLLYDYYNPEARATLVPLKFAVR